MGEEHYQEATIQPSKKPMSTGLLVALILGGICFFMVPVAAVVAAIAIPNLLEARKHGNEAAAIGALRTIMTSQAIAYERDGGYQSLKGLGDKQYIDGVLASGTKQGYRFKVQVRTSGGDTKGFWAKAAPAVPNKTGDRYFMTNETGIVYFSLEDGPIPNKTGGSPGSSWRPIGR